MAAKQGLSAQLSQASEDAKRAVLQRTSLHNSLWFSNLNTTCTIKSAPPRSPDVLGLLSVKSGWLFKRNEQHVWQARYCCVVPHTFLYYFDGHPTHPCQTPQLTSKQQEELNKAVRLGYGKRGQSQPRSSLYHVLGGANGSSHVASSSQIPQLPEDLADTNHLANNNSSSNNVQPAGIIDLECYTTVHRNSQNELLMELAGDETVNPDLRSFYFCANTEQEGEEWTQAFLAERHSALTDEREAYKQVCDGFAQQLQVLHTELDQARQQADSQQEELYRVRSQMEDTRRTCLRMVQEMLERERDGIVPAKKAYKTDLETIQAQDLGILPAVQLLCDYTRVLEETCSDEGQKIMTLEEQLVSKQAVDTTKVKELEAEIERLAEENNRQQALAQAQIETLTQKLLQAQKESQDVQKELASQRMEMTMHQSSTRTKLGELQSHKKILKKEVIDLRKKLEEANSELDLYRHRESSVKLEAEQERQKTKLLERYVEKIESQVKVQQNMMEMMSQAGSVYGGGSVFGGSQMGSPHVPSAVVGTAGITNDYRGSIEKSYKPSSHRLGYEEHVDNEATLDDQEDGGEIDQDEEEEVALNHRSLGQRRIRRAMDDVDNKSHMSELTEDRTQKQFDAAMFVYGSNHHLRAAMHGSPRSFPPQGPPAIIGIAEESSNDPTSNAPSGQKLDTIAGRPPKAYASDQSPTRRSGMGDRSVDRILNETSSICSTSRMSVAQKARLDADRQTTPVRIRLNQTPLRGNNSTGKPEELARRDSGSDSRSGKGFFANIGRRLEEAIDNSVLGVDVSDSEDSEYETTDGPTDTEHEDEKKTGDTLSEASTNVSLSLAQRQALQRAQQMKFLKEQGLIRTETELKGGAGSDKSVASRGSKTLSRREKLAQASRKEPARLASV
ncbi:PH domain containing protein [Nitzschia inconspicua]|uniref:PH domain containing protein n=1 Tax=Nitzschia inconspicua TaxID=303405 RepID=A0A9K3LCY6_9STRA|nr:PH domain containing protein [Nitzschia inconspicua]